MTNVTRHQVELGRFLQPRDFARYYPLHEHVYLSWKAGVRGKPGLNGDINSATEATREIADPDFEIAVGTNATSALCTFNAEGGLTLTTAGADGDNEIVQPHTDANQSAWTQWTWGTDRETEWMCHIKTGANITNAVIWAGLKLTFDPVVATDANQCFFRYEDDVNSGKWQFVYSIGGTDTTLDTGITVAVSREYSMHIKIDAARKASMWICDGATPPNANEVVSPALTTAIDLIPYIGVEADGAAAAKAITVYGQAISRLIGA